MNYTYSDLEISDLHKDATGYRPDIIFWTEWGIMTPDQKQMVWDILVDILAKDTPRGTTT